MVSVSHVGLYWQDQGPAATRCFDVCAHDLDLAPALVAGVLEGLQRVGAPPDGLHVDDHVLV